MDSTIIGHSLTAGSLLIAVGTFAFGYVNQKRTERLARTMQFLRAIYEDEGPIRKANSETAALLSSDAALKPVKELPDEQRQSVDVIMDYFDLISDSAQRKIIDQDMIVIHLGGKMRSVYNWNADYITFLREKLGRKAIYNPYETFVKQVVAGREV